jgi:hypothetical protein
MSAAICFIDTFSTLAFDDAAGLPAAGFSMCFTLEKKNQTGHFYTICKACGMGAAKKPWKNGLWAKVRPAAL